MKKWLDTPDLEAYNAFLVTWHAFLKEIQAAQQGLDEGQNRILTMYILKSFFALPYDGRDFYVQFEKSKTGFGNGLAGKRGNINENRLVSNRKFSCTRIWLYDWTGISSGVGAWL